MGHGLFPLLFPFFFFFFSQYSRAGSKPMARPSLPRRHHRYGKGTYYPLLSCGAKERTHPWDQTLRHFNLQVFAKWESSRLLSSRGHSVSRITNVQGSSQKWRTRVVEKWLLRCLGKPNLSRSHFPALTTSP